MDTSPPPVAAVYLSGRLTFFFLLASSPFPFNPSDLTEPYLHGRVSGYRREGEGETFPIADVFVSFKAEWKNGRRLHPAVTIISWLFLLWPPASSSIRRFRVYPFLRIRMSLDFFLIGLLEERRYAPRSKRREKRRSVKFCRENFPIIAILTISNDCRSEFSWIRFAC